MRARAGAAVAVAIVVASLAGGSVAHADTTRLRIAVDTLPLGETPIQIDPKTAVLPNGARELGPVPKSWNEQPENRPSEGSHCTDDRRGAVEVVISSSTTTRRIWEANGKTWLDSADVQTHGGYVNVKSATRVPLARIADGIWAYRRNSGVVLVSARDSGFVGRGGPFYRCDIGETEIAAPSGTGSVDSSPADANEAIKQMSTWFDDGKPKPTPVWVGVEMQIRASVSRSAADPSPVLSLIVKKP